MKCKFCKQPAGFLKGYHDECRISAEKTLKEIEAFLDTHKVDEVVSKDAKQQIKDIATSNILYMNYLESQLIDKTVIHTGETVIHIQEAVRVSESKNRCKMVETGYRYEKMPTWSEKKLLLDESGYVAFTDKAIYLFVIGKTMRYPYNKIVNYGYEKKWLMKYAYFDIKTSSPFPHRFTLIDTYKGKEGLKEQAMCLFIHCLK